MRALDQLLQFPLFLERSIVRALRSWQIVVPLAVLTLAGLGSAYFADKIGWMATALTVGIEIAAITLWGAFLDSNSLSEADRTEHRQHLQSWAKQLQGRAPPKGANLEELHSLLCGHSHEIATLYEEWERAEDAATSAWGVVQQDLQDEDFTPSARSWLESEAGGWVNVGHGGSVRIDDWHWRTSQGQLWSDGGPVYSPKPGEGESGFLERERAFILAIHSMGARLSVQRGRESRLLASAARDRLDRQLADFIYAVRIPGRCRKCRPTSR